MLGARAVTHATPRECAAPHRASNPARARNFPPGAACGLRGRAAGGRGGEGSRAPRRAAGVPVWRRGGGGEAGKEGGSCQEEDGQLTRAAK